MTPDNLRGGSVSTVEVCQTPPEIAGLIPEFQRDAWVYNPKESKLLVFDAHGLTGKLGGEAVQRNICPRKWFFERETKGWKLLREAIGGDNCRHTSSPHNFELFNNMWELKDGKIEELDEKKSYSFLTEDRGLAFIPVGSKEKNGGGVVVTEVEELSKPQSRQAVEDFLWA